MIATKLDSQRAVLETEMEIGTIINRAVIDINLN